MSTTLITNFSYNGKNPNFERDSVAEVRDLLSVDPTKQKYDYGHIVFCKEDGKHYRFMYNYDEPDEANYNTTTGWFQEFVAEGTGGGSGDINLDEYAKKSDLEGKQDKISDLSTIRSNANNAIREIRLNNDENPAETADNGKVTLRGVVTGIKVNGGNPIPPTDGIVDLGYIEGGGSGGESGEVSVADVTIDSESIVVNKVAQIPNASTGNKGVVQLSNTYTSANSEKAATQKAVYDAYTKLNGSKLGKDEKASSASSADKATSDGNGNNISDTYATKTALADKMDKVTLATVATTGRYSDLLNKPTIPSIDGLATEEQLATKQDIINDLAIIRAKAEAAFTGTINGTKDGSFMFVDKVYINGDKKEANSEGAIVLGNYATSDDLDSKVDKENGKGLSTNDFTEAFKNKLSSIAEGAEVNVQSDWNVDDVNSDGYIKNKPTIPAAITEETVVRWGFTKNTGDYSKPTDGIPYGDFDSNVQSMLSKANMAVDRIVMNGDEYKPSGSETGINVGTVITEVSANNAVLAPEKGKVNIPTASTNKYGVTTLLTSTSSSSEDKAATPKAVKAAYDHADSKQDALVSGTNIKTINGNSILGSGNIVTNAYPLVNHGNSGGTWTIDPNKFHVWGNVASLSLTFNEGTEGVANEYLFQFSCLSGQVTTLGLPAGIQWANGEAPTLEVMKTYQVSILNNCATILSFG